MTLRYGRRLSVAALFLVGTLAALGAKRAAPPQTPEEVKARALVNYAKLPLSFEQNHGQADAQVKFLSHGKDYSILLTPSEVALNLQSGAKQSTIGMRFPGAKAAPAIGGSERQAALSSYFIGNDPAKWVKSAPNYARVHYRELFPGIDLAFYGNQGRLEYDFVVAPGADPKAIRLQFDGIESMRLDGGDLVLKGTAGEIRQHKPVVYQETGGARQIVEGRYVIHSHNRVAFEIAGYDKRKTLVIDPTLTFGTYLGSPGEDVFGLSAAASTTTYPAVAADLEGNVYITGYNGSTASSFTGHPFILKASQGGGGYDVYVVKLSPSGSLVYSVVFGGGLTDVGGGIAVDTLGDAYITGYTKSSNFPITSGAPQTVLNGPFNAFVTEVNSFGSGLVYSTFLGGSGSFWGNAIAVDRSGNAYVTGTAAASGSTPFPLVGPLSSSPSSGFLTEVRAGGTSGFAYSTYLPAGIGYGVAVDNNGDAYVSGSSGTSTAPSPAQAYVLKVNAGGTGTGYGPVFLGTSGAQTVGFGIAIDSQNNAYVTGMTNDAGFPQISNAAQSHYGGGLTDGFAVKLNASGGLVYGTYLGGLGSNILPERGAGIGVDLEGNAYVSGTTQCIGFPLTNTISGTRNGSPAVLYKGASSLTTSTWSPTSLAGSFDQVTALAFDSSGNLYAGTTAVNAAGGGVYKQASGSTSWGAANVGITTSTINSIAVDPNSSATVYATGAGHIFKTTNGGTSWTQLSQSVGIPAGVAVAKTSSSTVYVGSGTSLIYSTNGGSSWNNPSTPPTGNINALAVDPNNSQIAYAGTSNGVFQTVNAGVAWTAVNGGLPTGPAGNVTSIAVSISSTVYAATPNGLFYTTNAGSGWTQAILGQIASTPLLVAVDAGSNVFVAFLGAGIATGTNGGKLQTDWSTLTYNGLTQNQIEALATPPTGSGTAYAGIVSATDAFLTKISSSGSSFLSSTCIGGSDNNLGQNIAVSPGGSVFVSGLTTATNFPLAGVAVQGHNAGLYDAFVMGIAGASGSGGSGPAVTIQSPASGAIESGGFTVTGSVSDTASSINHVEVWLDGSFVANANYSSPTFTYTTGSLSQGPHTFNFYAVDNASPANIGSASLQFTVRTSTPPPFVFGSGPGPDVIWEEPVIGWAQVWYLTCPPCAPPVNAANLTQANPWKIVGIGDFNSDGAPDVVWQDPVSGAVQVWYLGGPGGTTLIGALNITNSNPWQVVSVNDFNHDGHPDLLWQDPHSGWAQIWYLGGPDGITLSTAANLTLSNPWRVVGTGDFNNDGFPDVLWQDPVSGTVQLWYMGGTTPGAIGSVFESAVNITGHMTTKVVAVADFNKDGNQDIIFQDPVTGAATVYYYPGSPTGTTTLGSSILSTGNPWYIAGPH